MAFAILYVAYFTPQLIHIVVWTRNDSLKTDSYLLVYIDPSLFVQSSVNAIWVAAMNMDPQIPIWTHASKSWDICPEVVMGQW